MNTYYDPVTGGTYTTGAGGKIASGTPGASGINPALGAVNQQTSQTSRQMNVGGSAFNIPSTSVIDTTKMTTFTPAAGKTEQAQTLQPQMPTELAKPVEYKPEVSVTDVKGGKEEDFNTWINEDRTKREQITQSVLGSNQKEMADADFINQVAMAKYGRQATKDELSAVGANKFGLIGATKGDVLGRFGLKPTTTGATGLPTNSIVVDNDGAQINTDEAGIPDVSQSSTWVTELNNLISQIQTLSTPSAEETGLKTQMADLEGSARLGISNLGQELGAAMPLIQGEQAYLENQANIKLQTLAAKLGVVQEARTSQLTAIQNTANLKMQVQQAINQEKEMIFNQMQAKSANAQKNLALILETYKAGGGTDTSKWTTQQKLQLQQLSQSAGLDSGLVMSAIDAIHNGFLLENATKGMMTPVQQQQMIGSIATNLVAQGYSTDEAIKQATSLVSGISGFGAAASTPTPTGSGEGGMRTDRHNNPTAMTTDVAKTLGLKEGVDYTKGDPFKSGDTTLYTANLIGDGIQTTIKGLDNAANSKDKQAFYTGSGNQRWVHTAMTDQAWLGLSPEQKKNIVLQMYQKEGGQGKFGTTTTEITPDKKAIQSKYNDFVVNSGENANRSGTLADVPEKFLPAVSQYMSEMGYNIPSSQKATETEKISSGYYNRAIEANTILTEKTSQDGKTPASGFWGAVQSFLPDIKIANLVKSSDFQQFEQAQRNFINSVLRRESGAVISPQEFDNAKKQYFPQPGDSLEVIKQKAANRETTIQALKTASGSLIKANPAEFNNLIGGNKIGTGKTKTGNSFTIYEIK